MPGAPRAPRRSATGVAALFSLALGACAGHAPVLAPLLPQGAAGPAVELADTPFFPQEEYQCGPAALATVMRVSGLAVDPDTLAREVYLPGRRGSLQAELVAATRRHGRVAYEMPPSLDALLGELRAGRPVLVLQNLGAGLVPVWHYAVVVGYLPASDQVVLRSGTTRREVADARRFEKSWERADRWALAVLAPGELPASGAPERYLEAVAALEATGDSRAAEQSYAAAVGRWPDQPAARFGLGNALYAQRRLQEAASAYRSAIARAPDYAPAYNNLASLLAEIGCAGEALQVVTEGLRRAPETGGIREVLDATRAEIMATENAGSPGRCALPGPLYIE